MKKYIFFILLCLSFTGCKKSFLEKIPLGQLTAEQLFEDLDGMKAALNGAYSLTAKNFMILNAMYGDIRSDDVNILPGSTFTLLEEYNFQSDAENELGGTTKLWQNNYEALNNINQIINSANPLKDKLPNHTFTIDSIQAQALVLRALVNFSLSQYYSQPYNFTDDASHLGLPILLNTPYPGTAVQRATVKELYQHLLSDLDLAQKTLKDIPLDSKIHVSSDAITAFRARLYLYMGQWTKVIEECETLINSDKYPLVPSTMYEEMFISEGQINSSSGTGSEVIWQLEDNMVKSGYIQHLYSHPDENIVSVSQSLLSLYEPTDIRKTLFLLSGRGRTTSFSNKYGRSESTVVERWPAIYKLFRMSEVYLNYAEALWHTQQYDQAVQQIKLIQSRAYDSQVIDIEIHFESPSHLLDIILEERRKELAFEGHRAMDLLRNKNDLSRGADCTSNTCHLTYPNSYFILPIPQLEIDANNDIQPNPDVNN